MSSEVWVVVDLGFGDAGKGATVDFLVRERNAEVVVRFNGGAQAGHNVVTSDGRQHTFSQFGAGTFVPGTQTLLGPAFILHPGAMLLEERQLAANHVADAFERTWVDERSLVITPYQQAACRLREILRGDERHGTCGVGVGETVMDAIAGCADTIRARDLGNPGLAAQLQSQQRRKQTEFAAVQPVDDPRFVRELAFLTAADSVDRVIDSWQPLIPRLQVSSSTDLRRRIHAARVAIFEGAQGVLLDQDYGFHPHTTWSDCTPQQAMKLLDFTPARLVRLGVMRSYMVRHGAGPMPSHDIECDRTWPEPDNGAGGWQGPFRRGPLDFVLLRYAVSVCGGIDDLAVNHLDCLGDSAPVCNSYAMANSICRAITAAPVNNISARTALTRDLHRARPVIEQVSDRHFTSRVMTELGARVLLTASGPAARDRQWQ
jgi:adenylosuccinate synthase